MKTNEIARCRWCDRNDIPTDNMAIFSWKQSYGGFTGVCKACFLDEKAEARYMLRDMGEVEDKAKPLD